MMSGVNGFYVRLKRERESVPIFSHFDQFGMGHSEKNYHIVCVLVLSCCWPTSSSINWAMSHDPCLMNERSDTAAELGIGR